ncbi:MAG: hypothetical protein Q8L64_01190 [bacterium]|nr:hypothetical protein [bacterium]
MFISLMEKAERGGLKFYIKKIAPDDVVRSMLATAFARRENGIFNYSDLLVVGFRTLYDAAYGRGSFDKKLQGCTDDDYWPTNVAENINQVAAESKALTEKLKLLEKQLLEKIFSNQTISIASPKE